MRLLTAATLDSGSPPVSGLNAMPPLLETLARARANSAQSLTDVLEDDSAWERSTATLVAITPNASSPVLRAFLRGWSARGGRQFGLALDAGSFRRNTFDSPPDDPNWRIVRRGDDLQALLERQNDG